MFLEQMIDIPFEFSDVLIYLSGILSGVIIAFLLYVLFILISINKSKRIIKESEEKISEEDVRLMIENARKNYLFLRKSKDDVVKANAFKETCLNLVNDIAKKCFPSSKNPMLELSIDESILLAKYVIQRIEELLNKKGLSLIKKISISKINDILITKKKVENNIAYKEIKKHSKVTKIGLNIFNAISKPFKFIGNTTKNFLVSKILLVTIGIIGEEAYKIYTKQAIKSMDPEYMDLVKVIEESIDKEEIEVE